MDIQKVIEDIKTKYPGKKIVVTEEGEYQEVVCEIEPSSINPQRSVAVAVVGKSKPHSHKKTAEVYEVIKGELTLYIEGKKHVLREDEAFEIMPGAVHSAEGNEVWFYVYSTPGWTPDDTFPALYQD